MTKENKFINALKDLFITEKVELNAEQTATEEVVKLAVDAPDGNYIGEDGTTLVLVGGEITNVVKAEAPQADNIEMSEIKTMLTGIKNEILTSVGKVIEENNVTLKSEFLKATEIALTAETKAKPETRIIKEPKNLKDELFNYLQKQ